jgi:hypothetical protein
VVAAKCDLLGDGKIVLQRFRPVDEADGFGRPGRLDLYGNAVTKEAVDGLVVVEEVAGGVVGLGVEGMNGPGDLGAAVAGACEISSEVLLDVGVAVAVAPIAKVAIVELVAEQGDDAVLRGALGLANGAHALVNDTRFRLGVSGSIAPTARRPRSGPEIRPSAILLAEPEMGGQPG